jgi:hypothetical protein
MPRRKDVPKPASLRYSEVNQLGVVVKTRVSKPLERVTVFSEAVTVERYVEMGSEQRSQSG